MKAALISKGVIPPKTHDPFQLHLLLQPHYPGWHPELTDLRFLTRAAVDFRYPGETADRDEAQEAISICKRLHKSLKDLFPTSEGSDSLFK